MRPQPQLTADQEQFLADVMHHLEKGTSTMTDQPITVQRPEAPEEPAKEEASGFAAFDKTLGRYVGGVHRGDKAKAEAGKSAQFKAAKDAGHDLEVRPV